MDDFDWGDLINPAKDPLGHLDLLERGRLRDDYDRLVIKNTLGDTVGAEQCLNRAISCLTARPSKTVGRSSPPGEPSGEIAVIAEGIGEIAKGFSGYAELLQRRLNDDANAMALQAEMKARQQRGTSTRRGS